MMVKQVEVTLPDQRPAIAMTNPSRHGRNVNAGFNAPGNEHVPEIVMS